jgi:prepilin-type N-terminal cleavage/methylation domain-containing protein
MRSSHISCRGFSLIELLFATSLLAVLAAMAIPLLGASVDSTRARSAVRYIAGRLAMARAQAVARGANVAVRFIETTDGMSVASYGDGNADGVRTEDIAAGIDPVLEPPVRLQDLLPGVNVVFWGGTDAPEARVVGRARLFSFSPTSTATSGSIYVHARDGTQWAVRVLGVTARARVLRYHPSSREWLATE